ncbi:hypothetical protein ACFQL1_02375 [Halomicroarcula sp. GCM10025709]|uniref:hypothetical protein n=1 Tax=Haloarcula TaxID=2237 RepID=UPI0024C31E05|nr:hypothetical protein [Halomicroarcula sp. YJ-61-S]
MDRRSFCLAALGVVSGAGGCLRQTAGTAGRETDAQAATDASTAAEATPTGTREPDSATTETATPSPAPETLPANVETPPVSVPFTASFPDGLGEWVVNTRFRTGNTKEPGAGEFPQYQLVEGDGGHSAEYDGSVRLHVDGRPGAVGVARTVDGLTAGTRVRAAWESPDFQPDRGQVRLVLFPPGRGNANQNQIATSKAPGEPMTATLSRDYPPGTELRFVLGVWPGKHTAYVTEISARR